MIGLQPKAKPECKKILDFGLWRCSDDNNIEEEVDDADANGGEMMMMMMGMHVGRGGGGAVGRLPCKTR